MVHLSVRKLNKNWVLLGKAKELASETSCRLKLRPNSVALALCLNMPSCDWWVVAHLLSYKFKLVSLELVGFAQHRVEWLVKALGETCELNHYPGADKHNS